MKKTKGIALLLACVMCLMFVLSGCGGTPSNSNASDNSNASGDANAPANSSDGEVYEIRIALWDSAAIPAGVELEKAVAKMNELGGGRIDAKAYFSETLLSTPDSLSGTAQGLADITYWQVDLVAGTTPIASMLTLPFTQAMPKSQGLTNAVRELVLDTPDNPFQKELADMNLTWIDIKEPDGMSFHLTKDMPIYDINDLSGLKIIGVAEMQNYLALGGGNIVSMGVGDFYTSLEKGVVDGSLHHLALVDIFSEHELTKSHTIYGENTGLHCCAVGWIGNKTFWDGLPADIQDIVRECLAEQQDAMIKADDEITEALMTKLAEDGQPVYEVSEEDMASWYEAGQTIVDKWLADHADDSDVDIYEWYDKFMELAAAHMDD